MKPWLELRVFLGAALLALALAKGSAQVEDGPVGVAVNIKGLGLGWSSYEGSVTLSLYGLNGYEDAVGYAWGTETDQLTTRLEPGKTYLLDIGSYDLADITVQAVPPPGYVMEMEGVARERIHLGYGAGWVRLRVLAPFQEYAGRGGTATMLTSGRVYWQASLGELANGGSAGVLAVIDTGNSSIPLADLFSPNGFLYQDVSSEVEVVYRPANDPDWPGTIRQILAPQVAVDIGFESSTQAQVKFYHRAQVKSNPSTGPREFDGAPFAWYFFNQAGAEPNKITISCDLRELPDWTTAAGNIPHYIKRTVLERTGTAPNFTWKADDWYEGSASVSRDTRARSSGVETVTVGVPGGATATSGSRTYLSKPWGEEIVSETQGTTNAVTTTYSFYDSSAQAGNYSRPRAIATTGGGWEAYEYYDYAGGTADAAGAMHKRHGPFKNSDTSVPANLSAHSGTVTTLTYAADAFGRKSRPASVETAVNGTVIARSNTTYADAAAGFAGHASLYLVTASRADSSANGATLTTVTKYFREDAGAFWGSETDDFYRQQIHSIHHPDGRKQSFVYQRGSWGGGSAFTPSANNGVDHGPDSRICVISGVASGGSAYTIHGGYDLEDLTVVANKSTLEVSIRDGYARVVRTETHVWNGSAWSLIKWTDFEYNHANQLTSRVSYPGGQYQAQWKAERLEWERNEHGITTAVDSYDDAGRVRQTTRESGAGVGALTTRYSYDAADRVTEVRVGWGLSENLVTSAGYDDAGRPASEASPGLGATAYAYNPSSRSRTITLPGGATRTETAYADGQLASVTGTAVVEEHYDYGIQGGGVRHAVVRSGSGSSPRLREVWTDWLGRETKVARPGWPGQPAFESENSYDSGTGRLYRATATGYAPTRYEYDEFGQIKRSGLDISDNGLVPDSSDRITDIDQQFEYWSGAWWLRRETKTYPYANGTAVSTSVSRTRLTGHLAGRLEETQVTDAEGNLTTRIVDVNRTGKVTTVTVSRTGLNNQTETISNGFTTSVTRTDGLTFGTQYDSLLRPYQATDPRIGTTTTAYHGGTTLVASVTPAAGLLYSSEYDGLGRKTVHTDASGKKTRFAYNSRGQLEYQWGDATYPVSYGYDATYGDRTSLRTYRGATASDSATWPSVGAPDTTTFDYDAATGLLKKKHDAASKFTEFTYNARGQTHERFWSRTYNGNRVTSTYAYDGNTGELTGISYNDTTASVGYTYTRLGQVKTATDGITGTTALAYDGAKPWRHTTTTLSGFYGGRVVTQLYASTGVVGRARGFQLGASAGSNADLEHASTITNGGRLETLTSGRAGNAASRTFRYAYKPNSDLMQALSIDGHAFTLSRDYHANRDLLSLVEAKWGAASRTRYDYQYNNRYQRESAKQSGDAFADYGEATFSRYTYNPRGELTDAPAYLGATVTDTSRPLPGRQHQYDYDSIGNRRWTNRTGDPGLKESYYAEDSGGAEGGNALNQYRRKENEAVSVQGTADTAAAVVAGTVETGRQGRYWSAEVPVANGSAPWAGALAVRAARPGAGPGGADLVRSEERTLWLPKALQSFTYDDDGNLGNDGIWSYQYDAENRLVRMATTGAAVTAGIVERTIDFRYDYAGRRVLKQVWNGLSQLVSERRYLYDGWNIVAEFDGAAALKRSFTWGLDLTGSMTAAGGVGALLEIHDHALGKTLLTAYDGNGNVAALLNADSGALEAAYEYDPFGNLLRCEGVYAKENPFRFSTKWQDEETGLINYGMRLYSATLGRFINRDPIAEKGGLNLYGFCGNDGINHWDYLGQSWLSKTFKKIGSWFKKNWTSVVSAALNFIPGVGPILSAAFSAGVGYYYGGVKGMLLGFATSYISNGIMRNIPIKFGNGLLGSVARGAMQGAVSGGVAAGLSGGNIWDGMLAGATTGAVISAGIYGFKSGAIPKGLRRAGEMLKSVFAQQSERKFGVKLGELQFLGEVSNTAPEIRTSAGTSIWTSNRHNVLAKWKTGRHPGLDAYFNALRDPKSATHVAIDNAQVTNASPTSIWEVGVATAVDPTEKKILGNTALQGPGPNGSMDVVKVDEAFTAMGATRDFNQRIFFHDHSEFGSVLTDNDIASARALHSVVIARRGNEMMIYIPNPKGPELWSGKMSDFGFR